MKKLLLCIAALLCFTLNPITTYASFVEEKEVEVNSSGNENPAPAQEQPPTFNIDNNAPVSIPEKQPAQSSTKSSASNNVQKEKKEQEAKDSTPPVETPSTEILPDNQTETETAATEMPTPVTEPTEVLEPETEDISIQDVDDKPSVLSTFNITQSTETEMPFNNSDMEKSTGTENGFKFDYKILIVILILIIIVIKKIVSIKTIKKTTDTDNQSEDMQDLESSDIQDDTYKYDLDNDDSSMKSNKRDTNTKNKDYEQDEIAGLYDNNNEDNGDEEDDEIEEEYENYGRYERYQSVEDED